MTGDEIGAVIDSGLVDWQIFQQNEHGYGTIALHGRWFGDAMLPGTGAVQVRVLLEATGAPLSRVLDWAPVKTTDDGAWEARLDVPTGGLYRIETRYVPPGMPAPEWSPRGDVRHFVGVGDLWIIAGQSNSAGYGRGPIEDPPTLGVHLLRNSEQWALAAHPLNDSTDTRHLVNREASNPGHAPYIQFGRTLQRTLGYPIGLVQTALGGSPLSAWNPAEPAPAPLFENLVHCARLAGGLVRGILWYQGETDTGSDELALNYTDRFCAAVKAWRAALKMPHLPVLTVQLNRVCEPATAEGDRRWTIVRDAQRRVPEHIDGVVVVPALDLPLSDLIHISPAGNLILGERLAHAALGAVFARPIDYRAPMIRAALQAGDDMVVLQFGDVTSRMDTLDTTAIPFRVEDSQGDVPLAGVAYPGDTTVRLALTRSLADGAVVHGGYGEAPATVPLDIERMMPMLAFWAVPVAKAAVSGDPTSSSTK